MIIGDLGIGFLPAWRWSPAPFMNLSFLSLSPIPSLKITDLGLIDVNQFKPVPLFVD